MEQPVYSGRPDSEICGCAWVTPENADAAKPGKLIPGARPRRNANASELEGKQERDYIPDG